MSKLEDKAIEPADYKFRSVWFSDTCTIGFDCGECGQSNEQEIKGQDYPILKCDSCKTYNQIPVVCLYL